MIGDSWGTSGVPFSLAVATMITHGGDVLGACEP